MMSFHWSQFAKIWFRIFFLRFYLFIFRERGREREREGEKHQCVVVSSMSTHRVPGPQPMHAPLLGIEPVTLLFAG